jgi:hypothetical protein
VKPCRPSPRNAATRQLSISIHLDAHPRAEHLAPNMPPGVLGDLAADAIRATNIAVRINGHDPVHPRVP